MLHDVVDDPGDLDEADLLTAHLDQLANVIHAIGADRAAKAAGLTMEQIAAIDSNDKSAATALSVETTAAILAQDDGAPAADVIASEARDSLLFGMTAGVMNVDVVAGELSIDLEPREVQGMLEGRHPMTLREYVALQHAIERRTG